MVQYQSRPRHQGYEGFPVVEPSAVETAYAPAIPLLPLGLYERIEARHLAVSADGRSVAYVQRGQGSSLTIRHADPAVTLAAAAFDEAMIVQVHPERGVKVWGDRDGERGIWWVTPHGARLSVPLDEVRKFTHGPYGDIVVGTAGRDALVHVVRGSPIVLPRGAELVFDQGEHPHTLLPLGKGPNASWLHPPAPVRGLPDDWAGPAVWPLPFMAERVRMFIYGGKTFYLAHDAGVDAIWSEGHLSRITPEGTTGGMDYVWTSRGGNAIASLLRVVSQTGNTARRLLVDGRVAFEGSFYMRDDGFRWSPNGEHFVAHLTRTDAEGHQAEEVLVTRTDQIAIARPAAVRETRIDDAGRLAYVLEDRHGRRVFTDNLVSPAYPYAWNLSLTPDAVVANVLSQGRILRAEFPHGR